MKITERHASLSGACSRMRAWIKKHNLSWEEFCGEGIELSVLLATGDQEAAINRAAEVARRRMNG